MRHQGVRLTASAPRKLRVSRREVVDFVEGDPCVGNWLGKFRSGVQGGLSGNKLNNGRILCRFFKWLRVVKGVSVQPRELLDQQLQLRQSSRIEDRQWLLHLALEHSRDNPDFKDYSDRRKYNIFNAVKSFCDYHEVPLTTAKNIYGSRGKKKNRRKQIDINEAKKVLGQLNQRNRTICLIQLQSGMEIGAVLNKFSYMWHSQVKPQLDMGRERLKIDFDERKGNATSYFTYISRDGIHELRKWLEERKRIIEKLLADGKGLDKDVIEGEPIFITSRGTPLPEITFVHELKLSTRWKVTSHMFRKLFESEAKVPERAIDREYVKFFMGHVPKQDEAGGTYDRNVEIREELFEKEYAKLEPYINIYSSSIVSRQRDPLLEDIEQLSRLPGLREAFAGIVDQAKVVLAQKLKREKIE